MFDLCKYKDLFGIPGQGVHSFRIFNIAVYDVALTVLGAFLISYFMKFNFYYTLLVLFILGIILHKLFCVRTTIDKLLFN